MGHAPFDDTATRRYAGQIRSWQMLTGLRAAGLEVVVVGGRIPGTSTQTERWHESEVAGARVIEVKLRDLENGWAIRRLCRSIRPACIVSAGNVPAACACAYAADEPVWADLDGDPLSEGQAKAAVYGDDAFLTAFSWRSWTCLRRGDAFSTVSRRQRLATLGQLGVAGRLNRNTCGAELVSWIPNVGEPLPPPEGPPLRGRIVPADAMLVLWLGGWNTWADFPTAIVSLESAMAGCQQLHLVATGGAILGQDERTYEAFVAQVSRSSFRDRFHLVGWLPPPQVARALSEADVAIVADKTLVETELGCRNRVATALASGVPVLATRGVELLDDAEAAGAARLAPSGATNELADALLDVAAKPVERRRMADAALRFAATRTPLATVAPVAAWALAPRRAADAGRLLSQRRLLHFGPEPPSARLRRMVRSHGVREALRRALRHLVAID